MTITQLKYLTALYQKGSFSKAAQSLNVSQPTLSMQLKKLEDSFGKPLIHNSRKPITFTQLGKKVIAQSFILLDEYERLTALQNDSKGVGNLSFRVGIIPTISCYLSPQIMRWLSENYPNLEIQLVDLKTSDLIRAVQEQEVDYGIMSGPFNGHLLSDLLYYEKMLAYLNWTGNEVSISDLKDQKPWILSEGNCFRVQMEKICQLNNQEALMHYEGAAMSNLVQFVDQVGGYTLLPEYSLNALPVDFKKVKTLTNVHPVRSIIGISRRRNAKIELKDKLNQFLTSSYPKLSPPYDEIDWN